MSPMSDVPAVRGTIRDGFDRLIGPSASVRAPEDRRAATLISTLLIAPALLCAVTIALRLVAPGAVADIEAVAAAVCLPLCAVTYLLARTGRIAAATWTAVAGMSGAVYVLQVAALLGLNPLYRPHDASTMMFLAVPVLFASTTLHRRGVVAVAVLETALVLSIPLAAPGAVPVDLLVGGPVAMIVVLTGMLIAATTHRERLETARADRLFAEIEERRAAEAELARHRDELEALVHERTRGLEDAMAELVDASEAKSRFLANMSHELRTPLNSIIGFTGVIRQGLAGPLTHEQERQLAMVDRSSRHLLGLINQLLDLSRIEAGRETLVRETFGVDDLLDEVCDACAPMAEVKGLALVAEHQPLGEHGSLESDRGKLRQILLNLVGNAVKFTDRGSVTVSAAPLGDLVLVTVADTGIGIPADELERVFDEYRQVQGPDGSKPLGTGLGLTVSRRLAVLLGGDITVDSQEGVGSRFMVTVARIAP